MDRSTAAIGGTMLERGDRGPPVEALQARLAALGYYAGRIDGAFGGGTEAAVMDFQRAARLLVDGRAGTATHGKLAAWGNDNVPGGRAAVVYRNQQAIRNRPVTAHLEATLARAVFDLYGPGVRAEIYSGGQPRKGTPGKRTGSIRHDDLGNGGRALDAWIVGPSGTRLTGIALARLGQLWLARRLGGCGLEMAGGGIHLDEWMTPPKGGGMFWTYPYSDGKPWGDEVRGMLVAGSRGIMPGR